MTLSGENYVRKKEITPALTFIFQASINQSKIPYDWKTAIVAPVFKKAYIINIDML